ncbi:MAG: LacI family DNA-binding transcriptional regulator [Anaerolineae bacterium]|nr:LacI family DNA-binding transcriptional regulator [Anaerolineae bacterium]
MTKTPTQGDVAKLAGVSRSTVSFVLNNRHGGQISISEETRQKVIGAARQLGYEPNAMARSLRSGQSYNIGVLIPNLYNFHYMELLDGIEQELTGQGYHLTLVVTNFDPQRERSCFQSLFQQLLDGLILMPTFWDQLPDQMDTLAARNSPVVFLPSQDMTTDFVNSDMRMGSEALMDHLLALGHRRIGFVNGVARRELTRVRQAVYREKITQAGLAFDDSLFVDCGPTMQDGYEAALNLLSLSIPPTAIWTINDVLAVGALRAVQDRGLCVPEDVAVAGFDDTALSAQLFPPLTTVHIPAYQMGQRAAQILLKRIEEPDGDLIQETFDTYLVIRQSTVGQSNET